MVETTGSNLEVQVGVTSSDQNPLELLADESGLSKQKIKEAMTKGAVWLSRSKTKKGSARPVRRKNSKLREGDQLYLYYNPDILAETVTEPRLVADEGDYSVWDKPYGVWAQGSKWGDHCSIGRLVEKHFDFNRQGYIVHRLDRAASGLMIIAHNKKAAAALSHLFAKREVEKVYLARIKGKLPEPEMTINKPIDGKPAKSHVKELAVEGDESLLEVNIETGRKHQIRKHLAGIGCPIIGDRLYGNASAEDIDLQLKAAKLMFKCPISGENRYYSLIS